MHVALVEVRGEDFDVAPSAVDLLLVLDGKLDDQRFSLVAKGLKASRQGIKVGVLACLETWTNRGIRSMLFMSFVFLTRFLSHYKIVIF